MLEHPERTRTPDFDKRLRNLLVLLLFAVGILLARLWHLQVVQGEHYAQKARDNRLLPQRLKAPRGRIFGHDGVVLADNRPSRDLVIVPAECEDPPAVCDRLAKLVDINAEELLERIGEQRRQPWTQIEVKRDLSHGELTRVEEYSYALPGVLTVVRPRRRYVHGALAGQVLGYLGEISQRELERENAPYLMGDLIGRAGLERRYEQQLLGQDGKALVNVYATGTPQLRTNADGILDLTHLKDSYGHDLTVDFRQDAVSGGDIAITLDIDLQAKAIEALGGAVGAIAVLDADTGAVLALASTPGYDPSIFVADGSGRERSELLTRRPNPMRNRCYQEAYPPGSVFKILLAAAALEEGVITEETRYDCYGEFRLPNVTRPWRCWNRHGQGVNIIDALAFSCDVFFYTVGLELGVDKINEYAAHFGLGVKTKLDLPSEVTGVMPSREWKRAKMAKLKPEEPWEWNWFPGNTVNIAIGQGEVVTTPLQNAVLMAAILNGGRRVQPYLDAQSEPSLSEPFLSQATLEIVQRGLRKCVEKDPPAPSGTGNRAKIPGLVILGKTGSAQMVSMEAQEQYETEEDIPYNRRDHAWFVAGVLDERQNIAVCVLVEHGHHGSSAAAPLARAVVEHHFRQNTTRVAAHTARSPR